GVRPAVLRVHATVPLPVPVELVSVVQLFRLAALQVLLAAPSPVSVTVASPEGAEVPCCELTLRDDGDTLSARGTGIAVITSESITRVGEPLAPLAVTVMVST